jgi:carbamoylphosphate synthase large subunit
MNILISGIGGPTPIGIAKSIKHTKNVKKIIGVDGSPFAPGLYDTELFDKTYLVPHSSSANYWQAIERVIKEEEIDFAFIVPELEVLKWSARQKDGSLPCASFVPDLSICQCLYDKFQTFELLKDLDIVPYTAKVGSDIQEDDFKKIDYPFWLRSGSGAGALGSYKISDFSDFRNWTTINSHIHNFLMSEYLPGRNYAVKVLFYEGKAVRAASAERIGYLLANAAPSGISGMCSYGKMINNHALVKTAIAALDKIFAAKNQLPHGMYTVDFKENASGKPKITEINIRHVSFTLAFSLCGANFSLDTLRLFQSDSSFDRTFQEYRYDQDYFFIRGVDASLRIVASNAIKGNPQQ